MLTTFAAMDPVVLITFIGASTLLFLTPGADMMFAIASGMSGGPKVGLAAAAGIALGGLFHGVMAAIGLAALVAAIPYAFDGIKYAGAVYLAWLAWKTWTASGEIVLQEGKPDLFRAFRRGFVINVLNPKVALFVLAFLPQFTDPAVGPIWQQMLILGIILSLGALFFKSIYGGFAGVLSTSVRRHAKLMNKISATVFGALAARLALS